MNVDDQTTDKIDPQTEDVAAESPAGEAAPVEAEVADGAEGEPAQMSPEARFAALEAEAADLKDKLLRTLAEADNIRKRAEKQVSDARAYAIEKFAGDLLNVSDNLSRALDALDETARTDLSDAGKNLFGGIEMTQKELHAALARNGVVAIDAAPGAPFDPNLHQAVSQIPSEHPAGSVAQPFQSGWKIGDRTLRAAIVAVSTGPAN